jgi:hypothetical protein
MAAVLGHECAGVDEEPQIKLIFEFARLVFVYITAHATLHLIPRVVIARQRVRPLAGPMTGSGGRSSDRRVVTTKLGDYWMPRFRGA